MIFTICRHPAYLRINFAGAKTVVIPSQAVLAIMSGCDKSREQQIAEIKSSLSALENSLMAIGQSRRISRHNAKYAVKHNPE